ncbi:glycosyltransferase family 4 protein [Sutterella wadsworthensis]|uniref:glycosyltransferase family 4 protein n=1 Tax=Sutterella wadsworthensis TaxID=40545 RepID=UPI0036F2C7BB
MKIIVFVNEFFGAWGTARGGYGFLARKLLPKALQVDCKDITFCLGRSKKLFWSENQYSEEGFRLVKLPKLRFVAAKIVNEFDVVISIEATVDYLFSLKDRLDKKIIFWIQDPRTKKDWDEIETVNLAKEPSYWNDKTYNLVRYCYDLGKIKFVTQAYFLKGKAIELYGISGGGDNISFLPNPVEIKYSISSLEKKNMIIFLGRLDSVKRGWLFCEIAKNLPNYEFYVLGASTNHTEENNNSILNDYVMLKNLHFLGHVDGSEKEQYLKNAKILVNTSIHEALPVSFLEAFAFGITVVSNQNPDGLVAKFGRYVGPSLGDGWDDVPKFVEAIDCLMRDECKRMQLSLEAENYVRRVHDMDNFKSNFMKILSRNV